MDYQRLCFTDRTIQDFRVDYNYQNEQHRFGEAGKLWEEAAEPYSDHWNKIMEELLELDFTLDPTFNIYEANRDMMRARTAEWHSVLYSSFALDVLPTKPQISWLLLV